MPPLAKLSFWRWRFRLATAKPRFQSKVSLKVSASFGFFLERKAMSRGSSVQSANVCEEMYYKLHLGKNGARRASTSERTRNALGRVRKQTGTEGS